MKATGVARFQWLLPDQAELVPAFAPSCLDEGLQVRLRLIADAACGLATLPWGFHFEPAHLVATHCRQLQRVGLASTTGRLDHRRAGESVADFLTPLQQVPELAPLAPCGAPTAAALGCLRDPNRVRTHPLRQLCLTVWLHGSWGAFVRAYRQEVAGGFGALGAEALPKQARLAPAAALDTRRAKFVDLVRGNCSITSAAKRTCIDVQTGQAWAAAAGIACTRRPKTLKPALRKALIRLLKAGADKSSAAQRLGITLQAITRVLRTEVGLREEWTAARTGRRQASERRRLQALLAEHPHSGAKAIRWQLPATYAWLYRHDRAWLQEQLATLPSAVRGNHAHVDWDRRDVKLCGAVRATCAALLNEAPGRRVLLWRIYQRLPDLKAKLARLERLPLTRVAIERALAYRPSNPGEPPLF